MPAEITRINPDLALCWEDVNTLRIGFERALARSRHPSAGAQRLIGALSQGIEASLLVRESFAYGSSPAEAHEILDTLAPVLTTSPADQAPPSARRRLRTRLADEGHDPADLRGALLATRLWTFLEAADPPEVEFAIVLERFLEPLERAQRWLSKGIPHLPIRFTDQAVHVGPLIGTEGAPCHTCMSLAVVAQDPSAPILAAQLQGKRPSSETPAAASMASAVAGMIFRDWIDGSPEVHSSRIVIPVRAGRVSGPFHSVTVVPHPECACSDGFADPSSHCSATTGASVSE